MKKHLTGEEFIPWAHCREPTRLNGMFNWPRPGMFEERYVCKSCKDKAAANPLDLFEQVLDLYPDCDTKANLIDLITDAQHWCLQDDQDFGEVLNTAREQFNTEKDSVVAAARRTARRKDFLDDD